MCSTHLKICKGLLSRVCRGRPSPCVTPMDSLWQPCQGEVKEPQGRALQPQCSQVGLGSNTGYLCSKPRQLDRLGTPGQGRGKQQGAPMIPGCVAVTPASKPSLALHSRSLSSSLSRKPSLSRMQLPTCLLINRKCCFSRSCSSHQLRLRVCHLSRRLKSWHCSSRCERNPVCFSDNSK